MKSAKIIYCGENMMKKYKITKRLISVGVALSMFMSAVPVGAADNGGAVAPVVTPGSQDTVTLSSDQLKILGQGIGSGIGPFLSTPQGKGTAAALGLTIPAVVAWFFRESLSGAVRELGGIILRPISEIVYALGFLNPDTWAIGQYLIDLTEQAELGLGQAAVGRDEEIDALIDILSQEGKANACIVGDPGVGKTALVEGLAYKIATEDVPEYFKNKRIIKVNMVSLIAGNAYSKPDGAITRMRALFDRAKKDPDIILFMDEFHQIVPFAELFKQYLDRPGVHVIAATTTAEYPLVSKDAALERRFKKLVLDELDASTTLDVLKDMRAKFEKKLGVNITDEALKAAVDLPEKYMRGRAFPDKSIDVLSLASTRVAHSQKRVEGVRLNVTEKDIRDVVTAETGIPLGPLTKEEIKVFNGMKDRLNKRVIGQEDSVDALCDAVYKGRSGFVNDSKPKSSFLLTGTHGVGKTVLAESVGNEMGNLVKLDVAHSDFTDKFLEKIWKKPYAVVVFDNVDRANRQTFDKILGILENGFAYDSRKRKIDFTNSVVLMTANIGEDIILNSSDSVNVLKTKIFDCAEQAFGSNFVNKLDDILVFNKLKKSNSKGIIKIFVDKLKDQLSAKNVDLAVSDEALAYMSETEMDHRKGAFSLQKIVESQIEAPISMMLVKNEVKSGDRIVCNLNDGKIKFEVSKVSKN